MSITTTPPPSPNWSKLATHVKDIKQQGFNYVKVEICVVELLLQELGINPSEAARTPIHTYTSIAQERTNTILNALRQAERPLTYAELVMITDIPESSMYRYIRKLLRDKHVTREKGGNLWRITVKE